MYTKQNKLRVKGFHFLFGTLIAFIAISIVLGLQLLFRSASFVMVEEWKMMDMIRPFIESLATAFLEEFLLRVLLLTFLLRLLSNKWLSVLIGSLVFALLHAGNSHVTAVALISHFFGGLMYSYAYILTMRIWLPAGLHFGWNYTQILFGIPVSGSDHYNPLEFTTELDPLLIGGSYGFEGGLISVILRLLILCFLMVYFKKMFFLKWSSVS